MRLRFTGDVHPRYRGLRRVLGQLISDSPAAEVGLREMIYRAVLAVLAAVAAVAAAALPSFEEFVEAHSKVTPAAAARGFAFRRLTPCARLCARTAVRARLRGVAQAQEAVLPGAGAHPGAQRSLRRWQGEPGAPLLQVMEQLPDSLVHRSPTSWA